MTYVISDIHGCYDQFMNILDKIGFSDNDIMYVLGDVVDRGPDSIKVLNDLSMRANVVPIIGNHDHIAYDIFTQLLSELTQENLDQYYDGDIANFFEYINEWEAIGGEPTLEEFKRLTHEEREFVIEFLSEFSMYEKITVNNKDYILSHSGLPTGANSNNLHIFNLVDWLQATVDYNKQYFKDAFLVTGHTPTFLIDEGSRGKIYRRNNNINIDTGAAFGEAMGCLCLETDGEFYV